MRVKAWQDISVPGAGSCGGGSLHLDGPGSSGQGRTQDCLEGLPSFI